MLRRKLPECDLLLLPRGSRTGDEYNQRHTDKITEGEEGTKIFYVNFLNLTITVGVAEEAGATNTRCSGQD